jgi:(1->4)-alpha-D-glucan 1-alpha-D-glucosylmutase
LPKLWTIQRLLKDRCGNPERYRSPSYEPLAADGPSAEAVVAFVRGDLAVVVPVRTIGDWDGTTIDLPRGDWRDILTGQRSSGGKLEVGSLWGGLPVAVLAREGG